MKQTTIDVSTPRGAMPVHLGRPDGEGPFPLVVIFMDSLGIREALHDQARRLNANGYLTAMPDLFFHVPPEERPRAERLRAGDEEEFRRMGELVESLNDAEILQSTSRLLAMIEDRNAPAWGCVGFCMGGRYALRAAEAYGEDVPAASLLHPSRLVTSEPDSPHRAIGDVQGALYLGLGERDHVTPPDSLAPLRAELDRHGVDYRIEVLPGADHGFTIPGMPSYNREAAERAWAGTLELLGSRL